MSILDWISCSAVLRFFWFVSFFFFFCENCVEIGFKVIVWLSFKCKFFLLKLHMWNFFNSVIVWLVYMMRCAWFELVLLLFLMTVMYSLHLVGNIPSVCPMYS